MDGRGDDANRSIIHIIRFASNYLIQNDGQRKAWMPENIAHANSHRTNLSKYIIRLSSTISTARAGPQSALPARAPGPAPAPRPPPRPPRNGRDDGARPAPGPAARCRHRPPPRRAAAGGRRGGGAARAAACACAAPRPRPPPLAPPPAQRQGRRRTAPGASH
jgi:hypothetical protein